MLVWCRVDLSEYPPVGIVVWTTDYKTVRRGTWTFGGLGVPLEEGCWRNTDGEPIAVTAWLPLEESSNELPEVPEKRRGLRGDPADWWKLQ